MRMLDSPLLGFFRSPESLAHFALSDWDRLVREARRAGLLARLHHQLHASGQWQTVPAVARWHFDAASALAARQQIAVNWEIRQLHAALGKLGSPCLLLKGAAYVAARLPAAAGRLFNDIDLLVPRVALDRAEAALMLGGWHVQALSAYDERYYRRWMHEIPPMLHLKRGTVVDLHHAVLPQTIRHRPDTAQLLAEAVAVPDYPGFYVLSERDRILHSATHLFHDGELPHGLRDLSDIDLLVRHASHAERFWPELLSRAEALNVTRSLYYALRYARYFVATPIPDTVQRALDAYAPPRLLRRGMDAMFRRALLPARPDTRENGLALARQLAYIRAHALRMPPWLLLPHLFHKAFISPWQDPDAVQRRDPA